MMKAPLLALTLILCALVIAPPPAAHAQNVPDAPLIIEDEGEVVALALDGSRRSLFTRSAAATRAKALSVTDAAISPDGRYLIVAEVPDLIAEAWNNNQFPVTADFPTDLILIDLNSSERSIIAPQPPNITIPNRETILFRLGVGAQGGAWAPDSSAFAYIERFGSCLGAVPFCSRVVVYDIASASSTVIVEGLDINLPSKIVWTPSGIAVDRTIYDRNGNIVFDNRWLNDSATPDRYLVPGSDESAALYLTITQFGVPEPDPLLYLFDVQNNAYLRANAFVSKISRSNPANSLILLDYDNDTRPRSVWRADGERIYVPPTAAPFPLDFVLSPDGQFFAYSQTSGAPLEVRDRRGDMLITTTGRVLAWGAMRYALAFSDGNLVEPRPTAHFSDVTSCGPLEDVGLIPGGVGYMFAGGAKRIREAPRINAAEIGLVPGDRNFTVVDGQQNVCSDGIRWAQVEFDGVRGWTAQGGNGEFYMQAIRD